MSESKTDVFFSETNLLQRIEPGWPTTEGCCRHLGCCQGGHALAAPGSCLQHGLHHRWVHARCWHMPLLVSDTHILCTSCHQQTHPHRLSKKL